MRVSTAVLSLKGPRLCTAAPRHSAQLHAGGCETVPCSQHTHTSATSHHHHPDNDDAGPPWLTGVGWLAEWSVRGPHAVSTMLAAGMVEARMRGHW